MQHNFNILKSGIVDGGTAHYTFDTLTGNLDYAIDGAVRILFFTKKVQYSGTTKLNPADFLSSRAKPGVVMKFGPIIATITKVHGKTAEATITVDNKSIDASGTATLSLVNPHAVLTGLVATGKALGYPLRVELVAA